SSNNRLQKFDLNGNFITSWGGFGTGNGQFSNPASVAVDSSGNVYVLDGSNRRVQKFTSSGTYITQWGVNGFGDGEFKNPQDIMVDSSGNVYVTDNQRVDVQKFDSSGNFLLKWGMSNDPPGAGEFVDIFGIVQGTDSNIYVVDPSGSGAPDYTGSIQCFDTSGNFIRRFLT